MSEFPWEREILKNKAVTFYDGFEWPFDGEDLNIFKNAKANDVIRSRHFEKHKCIFFLECTPNGWSKTPNCNVWCAVSALPTGICKVKVHFTYSCIEVGYKGETTETLRTIKNGSGRHSITILTNTTLSQYKNLQSFSYKFQIKVLKYYNKNGQVVAKKNVMRYGDMIQELIAKNLSLEQELDTACAHNTELHSQVNHLSSKLAKYELKDKNNEIYIRDSVFFYDTKDKQCIHPREDIERHQKVINDVVMEHNATMREWLIETAKMSKLYTQCKLTIYKHHLDEEKSDANTSLLLSSYIQCKQIWQQQQNKMESITGILSRLTAQKKELKISVAGHAKKAKVTSSAYQQELQKYEESGQNRMKLEQDLKETLIRLNNEIDIENKVNKRQCELLDEYNTFDVELTKYKLISKDCKKLIKQYNEFDAMSEETIGDMQQYFDVKWIECMRLWYKWEPQSIICWIKYLETQQLMLSHAVNLDKILEGMVKNQIDGEALSNIDKEMLHSIGFEELNDRNKMYDKIRKLISKYPRPSVVRPSDSNSKVSESKFEIPEEYLCPHSKSIMTNPVQIFDGYTYEKSAIEPYLNKEKRSPVTGEECDEDDIWFTKNRKLKAKIVAFLSVNPQL